MSSPLISAQDRKRQILERRRQRSLFHGKRQDPTVSATSVPTLPTSPPPAKRHHSATDTVDSERPSKFIRNDDSTLTSLSTASNKPRITQSSSLGRHGSFPWTSRSSVGSLSRCTLGSSKFAPETLLEEEEEGGVEDQDSSTKRLLARRSSKSLFGAVMSRSKDDNTRTKMLEGSNATGTKTLTTPVKDTAVASNHSRARNTTPLNSTRGALFGTGNASQPSAAAPAGSPGAFGLLNMLNSPFIKNVRTPGRTSTPSPINAARAKEWYEVPRPKPEDSIRHILDWSLKDRLVLEYSPADLFLPFLDKDGSGVCQFVSGVSGDRTKSALYYWEYKAPATTTDVVHSDAAAREAPEKPDEARSILAAARKLRRYASSATSVPEKRQWQQAFQSLYRNWCRSITACNLGTETDSDGCYFYTDSTAQVIVFRLFDSSVGDNGRAAEPCIMVSSSSVAMRRGLVGIGVEKIFDNETGNVFEEVQVTADAASQAKKTLADLSPVHSDLEALRKAQAFGETAGADVSIRRQHKSRSLASRRKQSTSFHVRGWDDCSAFAEYFVNNADHHVGLPTLVSRRFPFHHGTLQKLSPTIRHRQRQQSSPDSALPSPKAAVTMLGVMEIQGTILPCAVQDLLHITAKQMETSDQLEKSDEAVACCVKGNSNDRGNKEPNKFFVTQTRNLHINLATSIPNRNKSTIISSTQVNVKGLESSGRRDSSDLRVSCGESIGLAVWDENRPSVFTMKVER